MASAVWILRPATGSVSWRRRWFAGACVAAGLALLQCDAAAFWQQIVIEGERGLVVLFLGG